MNRNVKTITKILITILMVIGILLILPKTENATKYTFDCYGASGDAFTVDVTDTDQYALAYHLWKSASISAIDDSKWTPGKTINSSTLR